MRKISAGNWKMNLQFEEASDTFEDLNQAHRSQEVEMIIFPPSLYLELFVRVRETVSVGAQNVSQFEEGAFTGEVSAAMLASIGVEYCLVGHSERREIFNESNEILVEKMNRLIDQEIAPIFCCGESQEIRTSGNYKSFIKNQLEEVVFNFEKDDLDDLIIAYEPIWAIGTGLTASPEEAQEVHAYIRSEISDHFGSEFASKLPILYGGSVKPGNAKQLFNCQDINGGLVGGASLKSESFSEIAKSF